MRVEFASFSNRSLRSAYIANRFQPYLIGKVLDVGCDQALLKTLIPTLDYTGIWLLDSPRKVPTGNAG